MRHPQDGWLYAVLGLPDAGSAINTTSVADLPLRICRGQPSLPLRWAKEADARRRSRSAGVLCPPPGPKRRTNSGREVLARKLWQGSGGERVPLRSLRLRTAANESFRCGGLLDGRLTECSARAVTLALGMKNVARTLESRAQRALARANLAQSGLAEPWHLDSGDKFRYFPVIVVGRLSTRATVTEAQDPPASQ